MKRRPNEVPCVGCGELLVIRPLGRPRSRCAACRYQLQLRLSREWRLRHPGYHAEYSRKYDKEHPRVRS